MEEIEDFVKTEVEKTKEFSKEKMDEAIGYIHDNIDKVKDVDISKKVYEYASYLEHAAKKTGVSIEHDVVKFAGNAKEYASKMYDKSEDIVEDGMDMIKKQAHTFIHEGKEMVDDFLHSLNTKKGEH